MPSVIQLGSASVLVFAAVLAACTTEPTSEPPPLAATSGGAGGSGGSSSGSAGMGTGAVAGSATAGTGGTPGDAGSGGAAGSAGSSGAGGNGMTVETGPSEGCGKTSSDPLNQYVEHNITVEVDPAYADEAERRYFTKLPNNYDPNVPWPVVFYGPGCGGSGSEGTPLDAAVNDNAILVFLLYKSGCFSTGEPNSPEIPYFDKALAEVQANYCTEKSKVFVSGYSSGGWLSNLLACSHGDKIRAIGTAAGGLTRHHPECKGNVAAIMHAGTGDTANPIVNIDEESGIDEGSGAARDRLLDVNGCTDQTMTWDEEWPFCKVYQGCDAAYPVVWCEEDVGHSNGGSVTVEGFWKFWSALPPL